MLVGSFALAVRENLAVAFRAKPDSEPAELELAVHPFALAVGMPNYHSVSPLAGSFSLPAPY